MPHTSYFAEPRSTPRALLWISVLMGALFPVLSACVGPFRNQDRAAVKIVSSLPMTGDSASASQSIVNAVRMAIAERGERAGDLSIVFEALDDATPERGAWDEAKEAQNATQAVAEASVVAYIGTLNSSAARVAIPILNQAPLLMVSPANTYPGLTKPGLGAADEPGVYYPTGVRNYARVVPTDDVAGAVAAKWAKQVGARRVYVLDDGDLGGRGQALVFHAEAVRRGLDVFPASGPETIDRSANDYRSVAMRAQAAGPALVFFGGTTDNNAALLWKDLRSVLGPSVLLMGGDGVFKQSFLDGTGAAAQGTYIVFGGVPVKNYVGKAHQWADRYRARYRVDPEPYAIYGYDAASLVLDAVARVGRLDRAAIRDAALATRDFDGVLGVWSLDANGDTTLTDASIMQVRGTTLDAIQFLATINPD